MRFNSEFTEQEAKKWPNVRGPGRRLRHFFLPPGKTFLSDEVFEQE